MTAPADVWAVETRDGHLLLSGSGVPLLWKTRDDAMGGPLIASDDKPVRFRLVRADEPAAHAGDDLKALLRALAEVEFDWDRGEDWRDHRHNIMNVFEAADRLRNPMLTVPADEHICLARVPDAEGGRAECSQTVPCPDHGDSYSSGKPAEPPRDDVGELRECMRELAAIVRETVFGHKLMHRAMQVCNRLAAPGQAKEVGDG